MSRCIQIKALEQKIERLSAQLEYLKRIDRLEEKQNAELSSEQKISPNTKEDL